MPVFVIQEHQARRHHYDLRLEVDGVLKSWAVPKGPSLDPKIKRLAVQVGDHELSWGDFEGPTRGGGGVIVWDRGTYENRATDAEGEELGMAAAIEAGRVQVWFEGEKVGGGYSLIRTRWKGTGTNWLLIKRQDEHASAAEPTQLARRSVVSGRTLLEILEEAQDS